MTLADGSPAPRRPAGRYGPEPRRMSRRTATTLAAAVVAAAVGWAAWISFGPGNKGVSFVEVGYKLPSDTSVEVTFEVSKAPDRTAVCTVRALNNGFAEVGLVDVRVGPSAKRSTTVRAVVPTSERAVSGNVKACALV